VGQAMWQEKPRTGADGSTVVCGCQDIGGDMDGVDVTDFMCQLGQRIATVTDELRSQSSYSNVELLPFSEAMRLLCWQADWTQNFILTF